MIQEEDKEIFEYKLSDHRHGELVSLLKAISDKKSDFPDLGQIIEKLDALLQKNSLPEFSSFAKELKKSVDDLRLEMEKRNRPRTFRVIRKNGFIHDIKEVFE